MKTINRTAITIRPKQPYIDWANSFDDGEKYDPGCSDMTWDYGTDDIEHETF